MQTLVVFLATLNPAVPPDGARGPWASKAHPRDVAGRHVHVAIGPAAAAHETPFRPPDDFSRFRAIAISSARA